MEWFSDLDIIAFGGKAWFRMPVCNIYVSSILAESFAVFWLHASPNPKTWKQKAYFVFHFLHEEEQKANILSAISKTTPRTKGKSMHRAGRFDSNARRRALQAENLCVLVLKAHSTDKWRVMKLGRLVGEIFQNTLAAL